jgi:excisionase family DNA binding protein
MTGNGIHTSCQSFTDPAGPTGGSSRPPELIKHLALALSHHVSRLHQAGSAVPREVEELAVFLTESVRSRREATAVAEVAEVAETPRVTERLLLTKREAADRLGVSIRTIERLVAAGRLPLVHVERTARFRVSDLEAYVHDLYEGEASLPVDDSGDGLLLDRPPDAPA